MTKVGIYLAIVCSAFIALGTKAFNFTLFKSNEFCREKEVNEYCAGKEPKCFEVGSLQKCANHCKVSNCTHFSWTKPSRFYNCLLHHQCNETKRVKLWEVYKVTQEENDLHTTHTTHSPEDTTLLETDTTEEMKMTTTTPTAVAEEDRTTLRQTSTAATLSRRYLYCYIFTWITKRIVIRQ